MTLSADMICLVAGAGIAGLVSLFKKWSFVDRHPKVVALGLAAVTGVVSALTFGGLDWATVAQCTIGPFMAAVATYEVAKSATDGDKPHAD